MSESNCPICYGELEVRDVAPCFDCGDDPKELDDLAARRHTYAEVLALGIPIVLCDFCQADFSSYNSQYFNRPLDTKLGLQEFVFIREIRDPVAVKDKFCPTCGRRLVFLRFLACVREVGTTSNAPVDRSAKAPSRD